MTDPALPHARRVRAILLLLLCGNFLVGTNGFAIAGLLPDIAAGLRVHEADVGATVSLYAVAVALAAPLISSLLGRMSRTRLLVGGLVLLAVGTAVTTAAPDIVVFAVGRVLAAVGGAAIVPTATAAAAVLVPPERRGRAIALVVLGFTLSTAIGSPLGTAIGDVAGWRVPLAAVAAAGLVLAVAVGIVVRGVPVAPLVRLLHRVTALADGRVIMALLTSLLVVAAVNACYLYSAAVTAEATGGSGTLLAVLLACYGVAGILGNAITGRATDRFGNRPVATAQLGVHAVVLLVLPLALGDFTATAVLFAIWGVIAFASGVPVQHRLVELDPANSAVVLSWFTTALYLGIAVAPAIGASTISAFGASAVPEASALAVVVAALLFQLGFLRWARPASA